MGQCRSNTSPRSKYAEAIHRRGSVPEQVRESVYEVLIKQDNTTGGLICVLPLVLGEELVVCFLLFKDGQYWFYPDEPDFEKREDRRIRKENSQTG
jgi:hypothetical protein